MKNPPHNLKQIIPLKANELFSITKYQKKSLDYFSNSFFNTYYKIHNKFKFPIAFLNLTDQIGKSLNKTGPFKKTANKKLDQIPYPSFPNKKPIQTFYKNSMKLVKYPKIQRDNFILYNYNKNNSINKNKDETKFFNTFSENRINVETQTYSSSKNKTTYKEKNPFGILNLSPIKKEQKIKYSYKLYNLENIKKIKNEIKKKLNINNFDKVLDNLTRLIDMRDEHNKDIKYIKVTNLLLDEMNKLLETKNEKKQKNKSRKKYKNISTSISQKYFNKINNRLNVSDDDVKYHRKKIRFKTFIPKMEAFRTRYSFNSEIGNKVEDKQFNDYENKKEKEIMSNTFPKNNSRNNIIPESKNENNSYDTEEDTDSPMQTLKSKYHVNNLFNLMNEKRGAQRRNINFDINNFNKSNGNVNIYNTDTNYSNSTFGKTTNNFVNQGTKREKDNKNNKSNHLNILNIINDLTSKFDNKPEAKNNGIEKYRKKEPKKESIKNRSSITQDKKDKNVPNNNEKKEKIEYKNYFKNEKLINLMKQFSKLENIDEENSKDDNSEKDSESEEEINNNNNSNGNGDNFIENNENHKHIELGKIKRQKRKAKTSIFKRIDFGIEIIKNICEDINLYKKEKDDLYNIFINIKNISTKPEITKEEEKIQNKSLKLINAFIKKYIIDMQKMGLTKEKPKFSLNKYFKNNLNNKLREILNNKSENNTINSPEKSRQKKSKKRPKNAPKKKLIYDNSYFFKSSKENKVTLKDLNISQKEESNEASFKENKFQETTYQFPKKVKEKKYERRNAIFKVNKKREGLIHLLPGGQIVLKEEEKEIDKENLLDRRLNAFFEEIKILKNINNNADKLNSMIDKEMEKIDYARDKKIEGRKYNFYEELKIKRGISTNDKKFFNAKRFLSFQSPVIFNIHKDK